MENHADPFLDTFHQARISTGVVAGLYKEKLIARAARAVVTALDAGIKYDVIFDAVVNAVKERNLTGASLSEGFVKK